MRKIVSFTLLLLLSIGYLQAKVFNTFLVGYSDFNQIENNLYIDSSFTQIEVENIKVLISDAKQRIENKFGKLISQPVVIISKTEKNSLKYGNKVGLTYITPFDNYVVIGYEGLNVDVIAHKLLHAEIAHRLGYFTRQFKFPTWIDEGISMQVDYRKKYLVDTLSFQELQRIQTLDSVDSFFGNTPQQVVKNYQGAKYLMAKILQQNPNKNVFDLLQEFKEGKEIEELFIFY